MTTWVKHVSYYYKCVINKLRFNLINVYFFFPQVSTEKLHLLIISVFILKWVHINCLVGFLSNDRNGSFANIF